MTDVSNDMKMGFIRQELEKHGSWLRDAFLGILTKYKHEISGDLINSVNYRIDKTSYGYQLHFTFLDYGRFFDIAAYEGHKRKQSNSWVDNANNALWGIKDNANKKKKYMRNPFYVKNGGAYGSDGERNNKFIAKNNKWYARTMYGGIGKLCSAILYGLTDEELERLKSEFKQN